MDLKERLTKYLDNLEAVDGKAANFAEAEIPLVVQEWLQWYFWTNLTMGIMSLLALFVLCWLAYKCTIWIKGVKPEGGSTYSASPELTVFYSILGGCSVVAAAIVFNMAYVSFGRAAKSHFAPRFAVIEQIQELAGKGNFRR